MVSCVWYRTHIHTYTCTHIHTRTYVLFFVVYFLLYRRCCPFIVCQFGCYQGRWQSVPQADACDSKVRFGWVRRHKTHCRLFCITTATRNTRTPAPWILVRSSSDRQRWFRRGKSVMRCVDQRFYVVDAIFLLSLVL